MKQSIIPFILNSNAAKMIHITDIVSTIQSIVPL